MKTQYIIGYQIPDEIDSTYELVRDYSDAVSGVYFALPGAASARAVISSDLSEIMFDELKAIRKLDKKLIVLYNANCYGALAASRELRDRIVREIDSLRLELDISEVTTTSPFIAKVIKQFYPDINVCASVNMRIGSIAAMQLLSNFDSFYLQREFTYDFAHIKKMKEWCDSHGKKLKLIANSGCIYDCPFHTYHDNMVAHEFEQQPEDIETGGFASPCWEIMVEKDNLHAATLFLQGNWIRPEDISAFANYFSEIKLATRMHTSPRRVLTAYVRGSYQGNLMDLTEPAFSISLKQAILDATLIPADYLQYKANCNHNCESCNYCLDIAKKSLRNIADIYMHG